MDAFGKTKSSVVPVDGRRLSGALCAGLRSAWVGRGDAISETGAEAECLICSDATVRPFGREAADQLPAVRVGGICMSYGAYVPSYGNTASEERAHR